MNQLERVPHAVLARMGSRAARASPWACAAGMQGCITGKDVIRQSLTIIWLWGPRCYLRCLGAVLSGRRCTFLDILISA